MIWIGDIGSKGRKIPFGSFQLVCLVSVSFLMSGQLGNVERLAISNRNQLTSCFTHSKFSIVTCLEEPFLSFQVSLKKLGLRVSNLVFLFSAGIFRSMSYSMGALRPYLPAGEELWHFACKTSSSFVFQTVYCLCRKATSCHTTYHYILFTSWLISF